MPFGSYEMVAEYQDEIVRLKKEIAQLQRDFDIVFDAWSILQRERERNTIIIQPKREKPKTVKNKA